ncbi:MAG: hypothetical protein GX591_11965 [Planctomycetes bacterium]|nr:hypothetical protein [Planctomycetota bacterium]
MDRKRQSLLMYLETRLVDHDGQIDLRQVNDEEIDQMLQWSGDRLICYVGGRGFRFTDEAWRLAHRFRRERAERSVPTVVPDTTPEAGA